MRGWRWIERERDWIGDGWKLLGGVDVDGEPAAGGLSYFGRLDAKEARDRGAGEVDVEDADGMAG